MDAIFQEPLPKEVLSVIRKHKPGGYIGAGIPAPPRRGKLAHADPAVSFGSPGFDRLGRPLYVDRIGLLDEDALKRGGVSLDLLVKYHIQVQRPRPGLLPTPPPSS